MTAEPRPRVLVVDDEQQILRALRVILRDAGFQALPAANMEEALDVAAVERPDAAIIDLVLPDGDGLWVADAIRDSGIPIIAMSAYLDRWSDEDYRRAGFRSKLRKPFKSADLLSALRP